MKIEHVQFTCIMNGQKNSGINIKLHCSKDKKYNGYCYDFVKVSCA